MVPYLMPQLMLQSIISTHQLKSYSLKPLLTVLPSSTFTSLFFHVQIRNRLNLPVSKHRAPTGLVWDFSINLGQRVLKIQYKKNKIKKKKKHTCTCTTTSFILYNITIFNWIDNISNFAINWIEKELYHFENKPSQLNLLYPSELLRNKVTDPRQHPCCNCLI